MTMTTSTSPPSARTIPVMPRLLPAGREELCLTRHDQLHGPLRYRGGPRLLIGDIEAAGLTGRGGAAFPVARKMATVAAGGRRPVVVANAAESEPASSKDKQLLRLSPQLVLDGLQLAAEAVGAREAYVYLHRDAELHGRLAEAIAQRSAAGRDRAAIVVVAAPPRFVAGEESAMISKISGGLAMPRFTPPRVYERGVGGAPTLVQNAETLAHVALIARHGAAWFRQAGLAAEPGTMLVTCYRADGSAGVVEAEIGAQLGDVLWHGSVPVQAVLTGGYHGTWITGAAASLPLSSAGLRPVGGVLGAGVLAALPAGRCGLAETARVVRYLAAESAGQCGPCLNGLPSIAQALTRLAEPQPAPDQLDAIRRWSGLVAGRGACRHPDGTVRFVASALSAFSGELALHHSRRCVADGPGGSHRPFLPVPSGSPAGLRDWS